MTLGCGLQTRLSLDLVIDESHYLATFFGHLEDTDSVSIWILLTKSRTPERELTKPHLFAPRYAVARRLVCAMQSHPSRTVQQDTRGLDTIPGPLLGYSS